MNTKKLKLLLVLFLLASTLTFAQQKLLIAGSGWNKVAIIDKTTAKIEWSHPLGKGTECNDIEITRDGHILMAYKKGAKLISKAQKVIWDFKAEIGQEIFTATQLPNGNYFLAICAQPARFITLNKNGEQISEQNYDLQIPKNHAQFRQVTPTSNNTIIIPVFGKGEIIEIDKNNTVLRQIKVGGNLFAVKILPNKNWLVACGDAHKFVIVNPKKEKIVKSYTDEDIKQHSLKFVAEPHLLKNGNYLIANWNGHAKDKTQAKIIEIDKKGKVVWTLPSNDKIKNISSLDFIVE
jgi:outer membrane protein assembly factor BamB